MKIRRLKEDAHSFIPEVSLDSNILQEVTAIEKEIEELLNLCYTVLVERPEANTEFNSKISNHDFGVLHASYLDLSDKLDAIEAKYEDTNIYESWVLVPSWAALQWVSGLLALQRVYFGRYKKAVKDAMLTYLYDYAAKYLYNCKYDFDLEASEELYDELEKEIKRLNTMSSIAITKPVTPKKVTLDYFKNILQDYINSKARGNLKEDLVDTIKKKYTRY